MASSLFRPATSTSSTHSAILQAHQRRRAIASLSRAYQFSSSSLSCYASILVPAPPSCPLLHRPLSCRPLTKLSAIGNSVSLFILFSSSLSLPLLSPSKKDYVPNPPFSLPVGICSSAVIFLIFLIFLFCSSLLDLPLYLSYLLFRVYLSNTGSECLF
ncbi:hypothetical protein V8C26DRAFT_317794 [Trichoderma gracile]